MEKGIRGRAEMNWYFIMVCIVIGILILIAAVFIMLYRKKTEKTMQQMLDKLDQVLSGNTIDTDYDESMDSAISERLNRVVQIAEMQRNQAQEERDSIKSLISDISHQVRTPLSNIMLYSGLLKEQELSDEAYKLAEKVQNQSDKLDFFMKELVKSSRTEQEMIRVSPVKVPVSELVNQACQLVELEALKENIAIRYDEKNVECYADVKWSVEAIGNVLDNAIKYAPNDSEIEIKEVVYDSFLCLSISDCGVGIAEEEQGLIFQRFYRSPKVNDTSGFGIGLYLVREVLSKQGGYVKVNSKPGKGAVFQLFFPRNPM